MPPKRKANVQAGQPPERVKGVQVYSAYETNITVLWLLPSHTQCLEGVQVCLSPRDGNQSDCAVQSSHAHAARTFTGLTPCSGYHISVTTVSSSGEYSKAVTVSAESACDLRDHGLRLGSVANFLTNQYHHKCVEEYEICWGSFQDDEDCTVQDRSVTTLNITELTYCSEYLVGVTALRRPGNSSRVDATATFGSRPAHNPTFLFLNATSIEAGEEAANVAMDCIDYYQVCLKAISEETVCVGQTRDSTAVCVPDLLTCTSYTFDATARAEGDGRSVLSGQVNTRAAGNNTLPSSACVADINTEGTRNTQYEFCNEKKEEHSSHFTLLPLDKEVMAASNHPSTPNPLPRFVEYPHFTGGDHQLVICLSDTYKMA
uniref:Fibronectin type-III domain-containing protein n=1 Tax=Timema genevievae TaxID=629358 RepID=A0A7R9KBG3_TIMGE|nr:unnamed protein product [Timema genevievae]